MAGQPERLVALQGTFNFRDLGGYPLVQGGETRWGRLYRSDGLQGLTPDDVRQLQARRLALVIDLRSPAELERWGTGPLPSATVRWEHCPVIGGDAGESVAAPDTDDLAARYLWYLQVGAAALLRALSLLAQPAAPPAVFHCAAGKDRTGVLAALVLDAIGVAPSAIVEDYAETARYLPAILERLAANPPPDYQPAPASRLSVEGATMERFLGQLHQQHGGAAGWVAEQGGSPDLVAGLRELLTQD